MPGKQKYSKQDEEFVRANPVEWQAFVEHQKKRILDRLYHYNNYKTVKLQLEETGSISSYQKYKMGNVSKYLKEALERIEQDKYNICKYCGSNIPFERLLLVPAALQCVDCDSLHRKD